MVVRLTICRSESELVKKLEITDSAQGRLSRFL